MSFMFLDCESLQTILCNDDWNASTVLTSSMNMFEGCRSLVGGNGTAYDENHTDAAYAHPDGLNGLPGYFTSEEQLKDLEPLPDDQTTTIDFSLLDSDGNELLGISLGAKDEYNSTEGRVEVSTTNTEEEIDKKLDKAFVGGANLQTLLPGTITFFLDKEGKGEIEIDCQTLPGFTLKVRIAEYGEAYITSTIEQVLRGKATVNYDIKQPTYVVIYLHGTPGAASAPAHIARSAAEESAGAYIWSITVIPAKTTTGIDTQDNGRTSDRKFIKDGILYIRHNGRVYTAQGQQID